MGILISNTDFTTGPHKISQNDYSLADLTAFISHFEKQYLIDLLGYDLFLLFEDDLTAMVPQTAKYLTIYNEFYDDADGTIRRSRGMKAMLKGFIFFEYNAKNKIKNTISGAVVGQNETSREAGFSEFNLYGHYNEALQTYNAIQEYIQDNSSTYPEFLGVCKSPAHWAL